MDSHNGDNATLQSQKHISRGITAMKNVIRATSKNINANGQLLNMKGDNTLISYIGFTSIFDVGDKHKDYILKSYELSEEKHNRASKPLYPYRASRSGYKGIEENIVIMFWLLGQNDTPLNKDGVLDNKKVQEVANHIVAL
ncbi:hypothetical protein Lal_00018541 [Lupinus albus]|nr:hypothetical protein Lal_00018541 [Lupinus albus]